MSLVIARPPVDNAPDHTTRVWTAGCAGTRVVHRLPATNALRA